MATEIVMPKLSFVVTEGTILEWLKEPGDEVEKGEPLLVIESEKANIDVESPATGILGSELAPVGTTVPVTTTIGYILEPGEKTPSLQLRGKEEVSDGVEESPDSDQAVGDLTSATHKETGRGCRVKASPSAKRVAREKNVDLGAIKGSGPGGRIVKEDVLSYAEARAERAKMAEKTRITPVARNLAFHLGVDVTRVEGSGPDGKITLGDIRRVAQAASPILDRRQQGDEEELLGSIQRVAAERMTFSFREAPHFYLSVQVDMTQSMSMREQLMSPIESQMGLRLSFSDILILALSRALSQNPRMNTSYDEGKLIKHQAVNVGLAVDTPRGLTVPVIHNTDKLSLEEIVREREAAVNKARKNRLSPDDLAGGTFTLSNLGMLGVDMFGAIINPPEAAILAVGSIKKRPLVVDAELTIRPTMWLTLSVDHRVTDGANAARFLQILASYLEAPYQLII